MDDDTPSSPATPPEHATAPPPVPDHEPSPPPATPPPSHDDSVSEKLDKVLDGLTGVAASLAAVAQSTVQDRQPIKRPWTHRGGWSRHE